MAAPAPIARTRALARLGCSIQRADIHSGSTTSATSASTRAATAAPSTRPAINAGHTRSRVPVNAHAARAMPPHRNAWTGTSENVSRLKNAWGSETETAIVAPAAAQMGIHRVPRTNSASNARPPITAGTICAARSPASPLTVPSSAG